MTKRTPTALAASVRQRLLNLAKARGEELQNVLGRYGVERFLYRLGRSTARQRLVLKGAVLFYLWEGEVHRPTRDLDFLAHGDPSPAEMLATLREVCTTDVEDDGLVFLPDSIRVELLRERNAYPGLRVSFLAMLATARIPLRIDFGFGDAVTPGADLATFPTLLDGPAPRIRVYPPETAIAEKYHAMVILGITNTRMKDFYDLAILSRTHAFDGATLAAAIANTFARRGTPLPPRRPVALTAAFGRDVDKSRQWQALLSRVDFASAPAEFSEAVAEIASFLWPVSEAAREGYQSLEAWLPGLGWVTA